MRDPRFNWLDAPRVELKFAASQQNAAARQQLPLIKRAAAVLVPKPVLVGASPLARRKRSARKSLKQRRCYCVGASLQAVRRPHFQIASLEERDPVSDSVPILRAGRVSDFHPPPPVGDGVCTGPKFIENKKNNPKRNPRSLFLSVCLSLKRGRSAILRRRPRDRHSVQPWGEPNHPKQQATNKLAIVLPILSGRSAGAGAGAQLEAAA